MYMISYIPAWNGGSSDKYLYTHTHTQLFVLWKLDGFRSCIYCACVFPWHCVGSVSVWRRFPAVQVISREVRQLLLSTESEEDGLPEYGCVAPHASQTNASYGRMYVTPTYIVFTTLSMNILSAETRFFSTYGKKPNVHPPSHPHVIWRTLAV